MMAIANNWFQVPRGLRAHVVQQLLFGVGETEGAKEMYLLNFTTNYWRNLDLNTGSLTPSLGRAPSWEESR